MSDPIPLWLMDAGHARLRQASLDARLEVMGEKMLDFFLQEMRSMTFAGQVYPPAVNSAWTRAFEWALPSAGMLSEIDGVDSSLEKELVADLWASLSSDDIPADAFTTATALSGTKVVMGYSTKDFKDAVRASFTADANAVEMASLVASMWPELRAFGKTWRSRMKRRIRTAATGLHGKASVTLLTIEGVPYKRWVSHHDDRVRETHLEADGDTVKLGEPFHVGHSILRWPGDPQGPIEEIASCRCVIIGVLRAS